MKIIHQGQFQKLKVTYDFLEIDKNPTVEAYDDEYARAIETVMLIKKLKKLCKEKIRTTLMRILKEINEIKEDIEDT